VVAVGLGVQGHHELTTGLVVTAVLGLALAAALWWLYFDGEDVRAERALDAAPESRNPWLALFAFGYAFLPVLGGIIVLAAGVRQAIVSYDHPATAATAWFLAAGTAVYVLGLVLLRYFLHTGSLAPRAVIAGAVLSTAGVGVAVSPEAQMAALTLILAAGIVIERARSVDHLPT
jgi:low temperature requirement protein LtrA